MDMLAADQQGPEDGVGVGLHRFRSIPIVGQIENGGFHRRKPALVLLHLRRPIVQIRNGTGGLDRCHQRQVRLHVHIHIPFLRFKAQDGILHHAVPAAGRDGHQEILPGHVRVVALLQPFTQIGEPGPHGELDVRLLLGVRAHQCAPGHVGVGGGHAIDEVALIGGGIAILLGIHGVVGAGAAAFRGPEDLKTIPQAVELRPVSGAEGVLGEDVVPAQIPVGAIPGVLLHILVLDGAEPQLVGLALALLF